MRKLFSLLIIFLLIFTYSIPAYAEDIFNENNPINQDEKNGVNEEESVENELEDEPSDSSEDEEGSVPDNESEEKSEGEVLEGDLSDSSEGEDDDNEVILPDPPQVPLGNPSIMGTFSIQKKPKYNLLISSFNSKHVVHVNGNDDPEDYDAIHGSIIEQYLISTMGNDPLIAIKGMDDKGNVTALGVKYKTDNGNWHYSDKSWMIHIGTPPKYEAPNGDTYEWYEEGYKSNDWIPAHEIVDHGIGTGNLLTEDGEWIWSKHYGASSGGLDKTVYFRNKLEGHAVIDISPIFEGWVDNGDGTYRAYFGYENRSTDASGDSMDVNLAMGSPENKITGPADDSLFPEDFTYPNVVSGRPGRTDYFPNALVEIPDWDGTNIVWTLDGRTATAGLSGPEHVIDISPIFEGWVDNGDGSYRAYFGYENRSVTAGGDPWDVTLLMGSTQNHITGNADDSLFPEDFTYPNVVSGRPGRTDYFPNALVEIPDWDGTNIVWTLDGRTATAGLSGPEHKGEIDISPIFEGWVDNGDGTYRAYFGYENRSTDAFGDPMDVNLPMGTPENNISGPADDSLFPEDFIYPNVVSGRPGRTDYFPNALVEVNDWDGTNIVWTLDGRTATAGLSGPEHKADIDISPIFEGWVDNGDGTYRAYFGYENRSTDAFGDPMDVNLPMGTPENKVTGNADDSIFPEDFTYPNVVPGRPGRTDWFPNALVEIPDWDGSTIVWTLDGRTATAGLEGPEHVVELHPIFEGYVDNGDGTYRAYFGYENKSVTAGGDPWDVHIPMGTSQNKITGNADDSLFPEDFTYPNVIPGRPGRTDWFPNALVEIPDWDGSTVVWTLDGRTATAGLGGPEFKPEIELHPIFEGWVDNGDGTYRAYFGYENKSTDAFGDPMDVNIPMGTPENKVTGYSDDSIFPEDFTYPNVVPGRPGRTDWFPNALVEIPDWDGSTIVWTLDGRTATAGLEGPEHVVELHPIFEGYVDNGDGTYRAYFGYENKSVTAGGDPWDVHIPMGTSQNKITGNADDSLFPEDFTYPNVIPGRPGRTDWFPNALVEIPDWDGTTVVWTLDGRTATAGLEGTEHVYYEITFDSNGGSSVPNQSVLFGDTVEKPTDPTRSGYTFTGWTFDGSAYDFEWPVIGNMILVAGWRSNTTDGGGDGGGGNDATIDAVKDYISTAKNISVDVETSELMANDIDADDFVSVQNPINGSVSRSGTTVTFTPTEDFVGTAYFYYTVENGGDTDNGLVVVTVEEIVEINQENTPLGGGNPKALIVIDPEITPLGIIDYSMPYIMGYPDTTFRPDREVTRGEMAAIFARILGLDLSNPGEPMYEDVSSEDWYYKYIQSVSRVGLFSGYDDNTFKPNRPVTHAEIASAFSEYWELRGIEVASEGDYYSDISGHWAEDMINRLYNAGISVSYVNGTFKPDTFTTRTELVVFVNRSLNRPEEFKDTPSFRDVVPTYWGYGAIEAANGYREPESVRLTE